MLSRAIMLSAALAWVTFATATPALAQLGVGVSQTRDHGSYSDQQGGNGAGYALGYDNVWGSATGNVEWGVMRGKAISLPASAGAISLVDSVSLTITDTMIFTGAGSTVTVNFRMLADGISTKGAVTGSGVARLGSNRFRMFVSARAPGQALPGTGIDNRYTDGTLVRSQQPACLFDTSCFFRELYTYSTDTTFTIDRTFSIEMPTGVPVIVSLGALSQVFSGTQTVPYGLDSYNTTVLGGISGTGLTGVTSQQFGTLNFRQGVFNYRPAFAELGIAVPEPGTWMMMIAGFGLAGAAARRQRRTKALSRHHLPLATASNRAAARIAIRP